ncbi:extradiol ring-cleavage dioxygenase [Quadrisphaera oryzae]|uniref:DODA-type extradiol aromatic ring-opening family dioxygenase n=1 Tax=Quadrisphaera TaxID=317661 RepID=UPI001647C555|nr:extradiol ring-cleavage dioxygenase [Quadrisphaera sp. RL12-1S]MBC3761850.1 extradiol ring-cleavage dioxygenase [Quadrisphaera sp. RL12-1S]
MARLSAVLATTHHPFFHKITELTPPEEQPPFAAEWKRKVLAYRETLTAAQPDVLVMVGSDHFHQFFADNYPTFLIGKQARYDATFYNEVREFSMPTYELEGHEELSGFMFQGLLDRGFDFSISHELKIDHSIICPIITTRPQADLPVVPVYTNIFAPPLPSAKRFYDLGRAIRSIIDEWPSDLTVAAVGSGHLSLELGGPRMFGEHGPDPEWDLQAIRWLAEGDVDAILEDVTWESMTAAGNATPGYLDLVLMLGIAGPTRAAYVDDLDLFHTREMYMTWYPGGDPR